MAKTTNYLEIERSPHLGLSFNDHAKNLRPLANISQAQLKAFLAFLAFQRIILIDRLEVAESFPEIKEIQGGIKQLERLHTELINIYELNKKEKNNASNL